MADRWLIGSMAWLAVATAGAAWAQMGEGSTAGGALLGGPSVDESEKRTRVVEAGLGGSMMMEGVRPEVAALDALGLSERDRAGLERVLAERAVIVDRVVRGRLDDLTRIEPAMVNRDFVTVWSIYSSLHAALEPLWARGPLADELRRALPAAHRAEYDRVLGEYEAELVARERAKAEASGEQFSPIGLQIQRHFHALQAEIAAAVERTVESGAAFIEPLLDSAGISEPGRAVVRAGFMELMERAGPEPSELEIGIAIQGVLVDLNADDRLRLVAAIRRQQGQP